MITLIRWFLMKQKEIKLKLALYSFLDEGMHYLAGHKEELEQKLVHEMAEIIHHEEGGDTL